MNKSYSRYANLFLSSCLLLTLFCFTSETVRSAPLAATPTADIELLSHFDGALRAVAVQDNQAFVGIGSRLAILDITDQSHPELLGITDAFPDLVENVVVSGNYAYVAATYAGVRIVDISDSANPQEVGVATGMELAYGIAVSGTRLFVTDPYSGSLWLFDVSDPTNPIGVWSQEAFSPLDILVEGNYLYLASGNLEIYDLTDINQPSLLSSVPFAFNSGEWVTSLTRSGDYLYAYTTQDDLQIIDISNLLLPTKKGVINLEDDYAPYEDIEVFDGYAFVVHSTGLTVVDIQDPDNPLLAGILQTFTLASRLALSPGTAYIADMDCLRVIDIQNPAQPIEAGTYESGGYATDISLIGHYAYLAGVGDYMDIYDVSNPLLPSRTKRNRDFLWTKILSYTDHLAYTYGGPGNIGVMDITDPTNPEILSQITTQSIYDLKISGSYMYAVEMSRSKFLVFDLANPESPALVGQVQLSYNPQKIAIIGDLAVASHTYGVNLIDISDPTNPIKINDLPHPSGYASLAVYGHHLLVSEFQNAGVISIYDMSQSTNPTKIGTFSIPGYVNDMVVHNGKVYIAGYSDVLIVDLSDLANPQTIASYPILAYSYPFTTGASRIVVSNDLLYIAAQGDGYFILRVDWPRWQIHLPIIFR